MSDSESFESEPNLSPEDSREDTADCVLMGRNKKSKLSPLQADESQDSSSASASENILTNTQSGKRRGEYGFYPPNLRVRIAKMALEKGVSKTADYFSDDLGRYVSPSTVASIRNQYMKEVSQCIEEDVTLVSELPKADSGRPLLLEQLDSHILQCVQKIKESGGAVNAAVIKRIARDIIIANNKSLLLEYGGPFELSNAWAERTLKRIGHSGKKNEKGSKRTINQKKRQKSSKQNNRSPSPGLEEMKQAYVDIIKSAVNTHGLSKELIPEVSAKRRRSQRIQLIPDQEDDEFSCDDVEPNVSSESPSADFSDYASDPKLTTKYKLVAYPVTRSRKNTKKRFRILRIPSRNNSASKVSVHTKTLNKDTQNKEKSVSNEPSVEIPEQELIEMAIPCMTGKRKRGDYASYTSEQRIKMAKMALESGVAKTAQHFTAELGRYVSPSSVASMRNQYRKEVEKSQTEVIELPKGKRGRPLLLGHLDSEIKNAIENIKNSGGKIGRNVVKSVARDIILANNRGLLKEYGGPLQLTNTWAESVMKRMGFVRRRKSKNINKSPGLKSAKTAKLPNEFEELNQAYMDVLSSAVNTAVSTHGLTDDLITNYDQYNSHNLPSNHIGHHSFNNNHLNHHNHIHPHTDNYQMEMPMGRNNQMMQTNEQEAVMGLNHLRAQVEGFSNSAFTPAPYYSGWGAPNHRDFPVMMNYGQSGTCSTNYNSHLDSSHMNHSLERQGMTNLGNRMPPNVSQVPPANYNNQVHVSPHNIGQTGLQRQAPDMNVRGSLNPISVNRMHESQIDQNDVNVAVGPNISATAAANVSHQKELELMCGNIMQHDSSSDAIIPIHNSSNPLPNPVESTNNSSHQAESSVNGSSDALADAITVLATGVKNTTKTSKKSKEVKRKRGEYGVYTAEQRMKMAKLALEFGVTKAANIISEEIGRVVSSSTVASMRNLYVKESEKQNEEINELPKGKRGRPLLLGDLDSQIQRYLMNIRTNGGVITRMVVVSVARGIITAKNKELLKEFGGPVELSTTWAESVIRRMGFVRQKVDGSEKSLPSDFEQLKSAFLKRITTTVMTHAIPKELILNFGQTALKIVPSSSWTTEGQCVQQLPALEIEDRREITALLTVSLGGDLLPLQLIYTGKTDQCHPNIPFPDGWIITHTDNHLCTSETMLSFAEKLLIPYVNRTRILLGLQPNHKALVVFDVLNMNQDKEFFTKLRDNNIEIVLVPTPCTSHLQPLELSLFGRFRDELYKLFVNWYSTEVCEAVRAGQNPSSVIVDLRLSVLKHLHAQWILKTHEIISRERSYSIEGYAKAGILGALTSAHRASQN